MMVLFVISLFIHILLIAYHFGFDVRVLILIVPLVPDHCLSLTLIELQLETFNDIYLQYNIAEFASWLRASHAQKHFLIFLKWTIQCV